VLNCLASVHKLKKAFSKQISGSFTVNHERNPYGKNANFKHTFSYDTVFKQLCFQEAHTIDILSQETRNANERLCTY
jgi:hypothetical protein